jgi:thioredoxin-related protein
MSVPGEPGTMIIYLHRFSKQKGNEMKSVPSIALAGTLCAGLALIAMVRMGSAAEEGLWQTDFKAAQAKAKEEKKYLLVDFTGSDWCGWCIKLHNEVFDKEPFKAEAPKQFVLVELDYPQQKKQSEELKKQNHELAQKYEIQGYPTVLVMDADGQVIAKTGYREGGPEKYLKQLSEFSTIYQNVLALKSKLDKVKGLDRAKLLDEIVEDYQKLGNESEDVITWSKEIIALDPDNKAGLKVKYEFPISLTEAEHLAQSGKTAEANKVLDTALALKGVPGEMRQKGLMLKVEIAFRARNFVAVVAALKLAKEAAPESEMSGQIDGLITRFGKVAEDQAAAQKLEAGLEKASGLDRAKLLDKLVDAKQDLLQFDPMAPSQIAKWTKEIIALDADGKAGLKKKYQFRTALADVHELIQARKFDEANAAIDKALETVGSAGDEAQEGLSAKATIAFMQQKNAEGVECLKKALAAAPTGKYAARLKATLDRMEKAKNASANPGEQ